MNQDFIEDFLYFLYSVFGLKYLNLKVYIFFVTPVTQ